MGLSRLFRSRWAALLWAAGIVWTAVDIASGTPPVAPRQAAPAPPASQDATGATVSAADLAVLANAGG